MNKKSCGIRILTTILSFEMFKLDCVFHLNEKGVLSDGGSTMDLQLLTKV